MTSKPAGIVGLLIGLLIVGGLAASPYYLGLLRSDPQALDAAVEKDVEAIRRIVLNLDEDIAAVASMTASVAAQTNHPDVGYTTPKGFPDDDPVFSKQLIRSLDQTIERLHEVETNDQKRDTIVLGTETIDFRRLKVDRVESDFKSKYLKADDKLIREAESRLANLRNISHGASSSATHLGVNRIKGIFLLAKGQMQAGHAQFERMYASFLRTAAQDQAPALLELRRQQAALEAQMPAERLAALDQRLQETKAGLAAVQGAMKQLESVIQAKKDQLSDAEKAAAEAQQALAELGAQRLDFRDYSSRYLELSQQLRTAQAAVEALRHGTLRDASQIETTDAEPTVPSYEGGSPDPGLNALAFHLEGLKDQEALLESTQKELEKQRGAVAELESSLTNQREELANQIQEQTAAVTEQLAKSGEHEEKAMKAEEDAIKTLKEAMRAAKDAVTAAKRMTADARQAGAGGAVDERLQRVSQDVDVEASMHCLAAECAYAMAQLRCEHVVAVRDGARVAGLLAAATGTEGASAADDLDKLKTDATNDIAEALKSYEAAAQLIGKANIKSGTVSISGKNYVWQVQVGQAAAHLLLASIQSDDADKAAKEKALAYNLLKEAAEKREQSPLLSPAIDTLQYLQKTAQ